MSVRNLHVTYDGRHGPVHAVVGASFDIAAGQVVAIVGESGSGKSTTAHAVVGLLPPSAHVVAGEIIFDGQNITALPPSVRRKMLGRSIGLVAQDPAVSLDPVKRIGSQVVEVLQIHRIAKGREARTRAVELLQLVGLPNAASVVRQYPHELSGGMQQRVMIAIALATEPKLIVADEPTSALDVTVQRQILDRFEVVTRETGTAVLMITHDLAVASDRSHHIVVMSEGLIVEAGASRSLLEAPGHSYTRRLVASDPRLKEAKRRPTEGTPVAGSPEPRAMVETRELVKDFELRRGDADRHRRAVDLVSLALKTGETLALVGESGSGKTTLGRLMLGLLSPSSGSVLFDGIDLSLIGSADLRRLRRRMQVVYQSPSSSLDPRYSVEQVIEEPLRVHKIGTRQARAARVDYLLQHVSLPANIRRRKPRELSGGQCQRVAIARALAVDPDLLLCDEPVSALDVTVQDQILELLSALQSEFGLSMLFISHDLAVVRQIADRVAVMRKGEIVELAPTDEIFLRPEHEYTVELLSAMPGNRHQPA